VGVDLQQQSHKKARLPFKLGGVGHYSAAIISLTGFYASYAQHVALSTVPDERLLRRELAWVVPALRATIADGHRGLVHAADTILTSRPMRKLQSLLTRSAHGEAHRLLVATAPVPRDKRMLQFPTDAYLPFLACPTHPSLVIPHEQFISGLRFYLLLPQLLRVHTVPPTRVAPAVDSADFSYQADACRHCDGAVCDRHLSHAHGCVSSSKKHIRDRHELVKDVRAQATAEAGYTRIDVEPRLAPMRNQRRADISFVEPARTGTKEIWHYTDDTGGHPLCKTHFDPPTGREAVTPVHTLNMLDQGKANDYAFQLQLLRSASAVRSGLRVIVYRTCSFTSLGQLGKGMVKWLNAAAGHLKKVETLRSVPRDDGLLPQQVAAQFRFRTRAMIQAAIMMGNGYIAKAVGL
jgi:hypothetical protein